MPPSLRTAAMAFALSPALLFAATVHRCEDSNGKVTFTHLGCPSDQQLRLQAADNPAPSGESAAPAQHSEKTAQKPNSDKERRGVIGIGQREDGCGNLVSPRERRKAMINKEARAGMTRADVESMLGKPDTISSQNGKVRYSYVDKQDKGRKRSISFDADGCVKP